MSHITIFHIVDDIVFHMEREIIFFHDVYSKYSNTIANLAKKEERILRNTLDKKLRK